MNSKARKTLPLLLVACLAQPAVAETFFRLNASRGAVAGQPPQDQVPDAGQDSAPVAPSLAFDGWSGAPAVGNGPSGRFVAAGLAEPVSYAASPGLPTGIDLLPDGTLSGSYDVPGTYAATVTATGSDGASTSAPYAVDVRPTGLAIRLPAQPALTAGSTSTSPAATVTSGDAAEWRLASGPAWVTVSPTDGAVSLSPPIGTTQVAYVVEARDASGSVAQASSGTLPVAHRTLGVTAVPSSILEGVPAFGTLSSDIPGATFSLTAGPGWLSVSPDGILTGHSPDVDAPATYALSFLATDGVAAAATGTTLKVMPGTVTLGPLPATLHGGGRVSTPVSSDFGDAGSLSATGASWLSVSGGRLVGTAPNVTASYSAVGVLAALNGARAASRTASIDVIASTAQVSMPAKARQGVPFAATLATNLSGGAWSATDPAGILSTSVSGATATLTAPTGTPATTYAPAFSYAAPDGAAAAAGSVVAYPDLTVASGAQGSISLGIGVPASYAASSSNAVGTVTYDLLKGGVVSNAALEPCGFALDRAKGTLTATSTTACSVANLSFQATDAGDPASPGTGQTRSSPGSFSVTTSAPNAQDVTPVTGSVPPVSAFWVSSSSRRSGTPYLSSWPNGPKVSFSSCDRINFLKYGWDFGQAVSARSVAIDFYAAGGGPIPIRIAWSNDNSKWNIVASLNPYYQNNYQWVAVNGSWGSVAARYWAVFYEGNCGSADGYMTSFRLSN